jgi:hypothetical protein
MAGTRIPGPFRSGPEKIKDGTMARYKAHPASPVQMRSVPAPCCGVPGYCINNYALVDGQRRVTVFGADGAITAYPANDHSLIDITAMAAHPNSQIEVAEQEHPENFLNMAAAAAFYNTGTFYHIRFPNDEKLAFTGGSTAEGTPAPGTEHKAHKYGGNIDLRYMSAPGRQIKDVSASSIADVERIREIMADMQSGGFAGAITGDAAKYGSKRVKAELARGHNSHIHIQRQ